MYMLRNMNESQKLPLVTNDVSALRRGTHPFDHTALQAAVAALEHGEKLPEHLLGDYRAFYGFDLLLDGAGHSLQLLKVADQRIAVHRFEPPHIRGYAMLCHGYYDHVGLYGFVLRYLLSHGLAVVAHDQIGHGLSDGPRATIQSFDRYVAATHAVHLAAAAQLPQATPWHWLGQSMGGSVVMETLHQHPQLPLGEVVLFAPLVRPYGWWLSQWVFALAKMTVDERPRKITRNAENAEFLHLQHADRLQPQILPVAWVQAMVDWFQRLERYPGSNLRPKIIQGHQDRTVSWRHNQKFLGQRYADAQWCILPQASHHLANESTHIRQQMYAWLDQQCVWVANGSG